MYVCDMGCFGGYKNILSDSENKDINYISLKENVISKVSEDLKLDNNQIVKISEYKMFNNIWEWIISVHPEICMTESERDVYDAK